MDLHTHIAKYFIKFVFSTNIENNQAKIIRVKTIIIHTSTSNKNKILWK